ncbi:MAG: CPBP family intramembrane metalloprotease [Acidobacteria bacterium]|nr:CPBP family intramembrane metalloprotease [Acidobacteriota bacterium]
MTAEPALECADTPPEIPRPAPRPTFADRSVALLEVLLCSDYPTQLFLGATLVRLGVAPLNDDGGLSLRYVVTLSLVDTAALVGLILLFLRARGEPARAVLFGTRPIRPELRAGALLIAPAFVIAAVVLGVTMALAPELHTVPDNPLKGLMRGPGQTALFALVVVVAGGIREEIQRAFLMHRFDRWLGGSAVGLVVTSVAFGLGHIPQGIDATIATAALGAFWGIVYLRRRSAVAPIVSHSGFNLLQLVQYLAIGR